MNTIFLRPGEYNTELAISEILEIINETEGPLMLAVAYFTHGALIEALKDRAKRGRKTYIILNTSDLIRPRTPDESLLYISEDLIELIALTEDIKSLGIKSLGFKTKGIMNKGIRGSYQNMHHKFVVSHEKVIFGSLNWTKAALNQNYELIHISNNLMLVNQFLEEFNYMWGVGQDIYTYRGKIRGIICPECEDSEGVDFESFGPVCTFCNHSFKFS